MPFLSQCSVLKLLLLNSEDAFSETRLFSSNCRCSPASVPRGKTTSTAIGHLLGFDILGFSVYKTQTLIGFDFY